jgi:hypothetical protein
VSLPIVVISTGFQTPPDARHRHHVSVSDQTVPHDHIMVDAAALPGCPAHFETLTSVVSQMAPETVIVSVDLDDWLATPTALEGVLREHETGAWMTWGSFRFADGRPGFARDVGPNPRRGPWVMSHLKTYRAGLFQRIRPEDLRIDGEWLPHARDLAVMIPCAEICGPARRRFIPDVLYEYNLASSSEFSAGPGSGFWALEQRCVEYVRSRAPYEQIDLL